MSGIVIGSLLTLAPVFGVVGTMVGMIGAFSDLAGAGVSDPKALSAHIGQSLFWTATGLFLLPVGLVLLTVSVIFYTRGRPLAPPPLPATDGR